MMAPTKENENDLNNTSTSPSSPSTGNRLNIFKFGSRRKSSNDTNQQKLQQEEKQEKPKINTQTQQTRFYNEDEEDLDPINSRDYERNDENIQSYPPSSYFDQPGSYLQSPTSPSESSLIFERSVEDPAQVYQQTTCPRCGQQQNPNNPKLNCNHQSIVNLPSHYSVENFVSPCLDATTKILTDESTDLDNVDMVYSRRPSSVMGLNMALGRNKSFANYNDADGGPATPFSSRSRTNSQANITKTSSLANLRDPDSVKRPPTLSFYSYADMINNENPNPKRPSISQSLSSSFVNTRGNQSRSNSVSTNLGAGNSITPQRNNIINPLTATNSLSATNTNNNANPRSSFSSPFNPNLYHRPSQSSHSKKKFQITPDSPNSSDSESEYHQSYSRPQSKRNSVNSKLNKTYSNQSSIQHSLHSPGSLNSRRYSNLDDNFYNSSDNESLVISSIGDQLRRNNGEIKSSSNSIIA